MIMAWGLELGTPKLEVKWVMEALFPNDLIVVLDRMLEWAWSGFNLTMVSVLRMRRKEKCLENLVSCSGQLG